MRSCCSRAGVAAVTQRLYATKMMLLATILTIAGLALMVVAEWVIPTGSPHWLADLPISDVGSALFTTGLVVIALEYLDGRDSEERAGQRLRRVLQSEAPAIRDAVIDGFAFKSGDLARVATPETLDQIVRNSLALRLDDDVFAAEVYDDIRDQAIRAPERWHDLKISVDLSPDQGDSTRAPSFVTTVRWEPRRCWCFTRTTSTPCSRRICDEPCWRRPGSNRRG